MNKVIAFDTETYYDREFGIQTHGLYGYTHDERFTCYMVSASDGETSWAGEPKDFNWDCLEGATVVAHNAAFDRAVYESMVEQGMAPRVAIKEWVCSANLSAYVCNRRSLADACKHLLKVDVDKSMRNYMKGKSWQDAIDAGKANDLLKYARLDAKYCWMLWDKYSDQWPEEERALAKLTMDQGYRGVQLDMPLLNRYIALAQDAQIAIEKSLPWLKTGSKPTSTKAIAEQCRENGIPSPPVKSHDGGEEKFAWWEATYGPKFEWVSSVAQWRVVNKFLGGLERLKAWSRPDGTVPFSLKYFGAHTGRWSGDSGFNMQNLRKVPLYLDKQTKLPVAEPKEGDHVLDIRGVFIPRPGMRMVTSDLSQIEPRVLDWVVGNTERLKEIATGMSIYEVHARNSLGWTGGKLKDEDPALYTRAKAEVLALGYGCGSERYVEAAWTLARYKVELVDAVKEVAEFRERNPKITGLWRQLDTAFKNSLSTSFEMELPSGRSMRYPKVRREFRRYRDKKTGEIVPKTVYSADVGGRHKPHYGGLLTENLIQAISRDVFGHQLLQLAKIPGLWVLWTCHDEAIMEIEGNVELGSIERIMSTAPGWLQGCPVACEAAIVERYKK